MLGCGGGGSSSSNADLDAPVERVMGGPDGAPAITADGAGDLTLGDLRDGNVPENGRVADIRAVDGSAATGEDAPATTGGDGGTDSAAAQDDVPEDRSVPDAPAPDTGQTSDARIGFPDSIDGVGGMDSGTSACPAISRPQPLVPGSIIPAQKCVFFDGSQAVTSASSAADLLAVGMSAGTVRLYRTSDGARRTQFVVGNTLSSLSLSPDGQTLATWSTSDSGNAEVKLWRVSDFALKQTISTSASGKLLFTNDSASLVGYSTQKVQMWRATDGMPTSAAFVPPTDTVVAAISPDGANLATGSVSYASPGQVRVWRMSDQQQLASFSVGFFATRGSDVLDLAFSPDGKQLAVQSVYSTSVWNTTDWTLAFPAVESGARTLAYSPDSALLAVGYIQQTMSTAPGLTFMDPKTGSTRSSIRGVYGRVQFSSDGKLLTLYSSAAGATVVDVATGVVVSTWQDPTVDIGWASAAAFGSEDSRLTVMSKHSLISPQDSHVSSICLGATERTQSISGDGQVVSADGAWVVAYVPWDSSALSLLSASNMAVAKTISGVTGIPFVLSPSGDGMLLLNLTPTVPYLSFWSFNAGAVSRDFTDPFGYSNPAFSADGASVAAQNGDHGNGSYPIRIIDFATGNTLLSLPSSASTAQPSFAPDGQHVVAVGNTVLVWDLATKTGTTLANAAGPVAIAGNGLIATAGPNSTVLFWSGDGKSLLGTLPVRPSTLKSIALNSDGTLLATGHEDATVTVWCP